MLKNYFKIAFRNLFNNKVYSFINILGLAAGLCCVFLIFMYVTHELSYDTFHEKYDKLYRVTESYTTEETTDTYATTYSALAPALKEEFPSINNATHLYPLSGLITGPDNISYQEDGIVLADSSFFEMFSFSLINGNPETVLGQPLTMVLTEKAAVKFFGNENPVGKSLRVKDTRNTFDFEITGVAENPPPNSHIQFDYVISYESLNRLRPWEYNVKYYPPMYTYVELSSAEDAAFIESRFDIFEQKYYGNTYAEAYSFALQPVSEIHLHSNLQNELSANFDIAYIYLFSCIGLFILGIACINFMNLATARSAKRAREVGMRKTLGAERAQVIGQFLGEAFIMTCLGFGLSLLLLEAVLPYFNEITGNEFMPAAFFDWNIFLLILGVIFGVSAISGSYPAFYLSSFKPIQVLKGESVSEKSFTASFRKGLVIFQFCISIVLISSTIIITQQLNYIQNEKLGFNKENVLIIPVRETANQFNINTLKEEILTVPGVQSAAAVSGLPSIKSGIHGFMATPGDNPTDSVVMQTLTADFDFVKTLELNVINGRDFNESYGTDENEAFIINETAAKRLGWTDNPLDKELTLSFYVTDLVRKKGKVIGIVEDFQYNSLHDPIDPVLIHVFKKTFYHDYLAMRISSGNIQHSMESLQEKWAAFNPERPFEYFFLDNTFDSMYRSETNLSRIFNGFAILAILIACLGLFGLVSYSTEKRTKEIGIRKVLGATVANIIGMLSKDFIKLVVLGFVIAVPIAWYAMNQWLADFAYRIEIGIGIFALAGGAALVIALLTVSWQAVKAAVANPVKSLRSE